MHDRSVEMSSNSRSCYHKVSHFRGRLSVSYTGIDSLVPGFQFASLLREVIQRARRNKVLPPASRPSSPNRQQLPPPAWPSPNPSTSAQSTQSANTNTKPQNFGGSFSFDQPTEPFPALDFSYADQLFSNTGSGRNGHEAETPFTTLVGYLVQS